MAADEEGFLQGIEAAWEDDALRLIYADWLQERDDPRAEFLRLECQVVRRSPTEKEDQRLRKRLQRLAKKFDREWLLRVCRIRDILGLGAAEEAYARALHRQLRMELAVRLPKAVAEVDGLGVHWKCLAELEHRSCSVSCFNSASERNPAPVFVVEFEETSSPHLWGRTRDQAAVVGAACAWLEGQSVQELYARFAFVEEDQRALEKLQREVIALQASLAEQTAQEWEIGLSESRALWFRTDDRSCKLGHNADNNHFRGSFFWDECLQFETRTEDPALLANLLKRWICDRAMPSVMQREAPSITLTSVAPYYEQGRGIEGEFIESWQGVQQFYQQIEPHVGPQVARLISQLRSAGYERTLRAGTSLYYLLVSRSRRHGLRREQPHLAFSFGGARFTGQALAVGEMSVTVFLDGVGQTIVFPSIELTPNLNELLKHLEAKPID